MSFSDYLSNAWATHATDPRQVADTFKENFKLMQTEDDVMAMARIIVHVTGEHLGDWTLGIDLLKKLKNNATIKDKQEMNRLVAILNVGNFPTTPLDTFSNSDRVRILSAVSSALANLGGIKKADLFFTEASALAQNLEAGDPAFKVLAINSNNLACTLEEKKEVSTLSIELMLNASHAARIYWEKAGTWLEVERAEYRLSQSYFKAQNYELAREHAEKCLEIVLSNHAEALETFFAYESLSMIYQKLNDQFSYERNLQLMNASFDQLSSADQEWCKESLKKFE
jgi:tetratricopeptide (TPR) repeat protein